MKHERSFNNYNLTLGMVSKYILVKQNSDVFKLFIMDSGIMKEKAED